MTSRMVAALLAALLAAVTTAAAAGAEASAPPSESPKIPSKPAVGRLRLSPEGHFAAPPSLDPKVGGGSMQGEPLVLQEAHNLHEMLKMQHTSAKSSTLHGKVHGKGGPHPPTERRATLIENAPVFMDLGLGSDCTKTMDCEARLVCTTGKCAPCTLSSECQARGPEEVCAANEATNEATHEAANEDWECGHKDLLPHIDHADRILLALAFLTVAVAVPVGVGGGPILVPVLLGIGHFSPHAAVALSPAAIFGGALASNMLNLRRHYLTSSDKTLIAFDVCLLMAPVLVFGTSVGVIVNAVTPRWLLASLLVPLFFAIFLATASKAVALYRKETAPPEKREEQQRLLHPHEEAEGCTPLSFGQKLHPVTSGEVTSLLEKEARALPSQAMYALAAAAIVVFCSTVRASSSRDASSLLACGSFGYWLCLFAPLPFVAALTYHTASGLARGHEARLSLGFDFSDGDVRWVPETIRKFIALSAISGVLAGSLGIAAGLIVGPILLAENIPPVITVATTGLIVLLVSGSATVQFLLLGQLPPDYALTLALVCFAGGAIGNVLLTAAVSKSRSSWVVVGLLAATILACDAVTTVTAFRSVSALEAATIGEAGPFDPGFFVRPLCS